MPRTSWATWARVVSRPWPCEWTPTRSSSPPSGVNRAVACSWARHHRHPPRCVHRGAVGRLLAEHRVAPAHIARRAVRSGGGFISVSGCGAGLVPAPGTVRVPRRASRQPVADPVRRARERRRGPPQTLGIVPAVEVLGGDVVERHLLGPHEVLQPERDRVHPELAGHRVEQHLEREADPGSRDSPVRQDGRLVGRHRPGAAVVSLEDVGAGEDAADLGGFESGRERVGGIGARVDVGLALDPQEAPVRRRVAGDHVVVLAAVRVPGELLAPVFDPAHRMPAPHREPAEEHLLGEQDPLVAEAAAHVGGHHPDAALLDPEALREPVPHDVRHLARGVHHQHVLAPVAIRERRPALQRRHALAGRPEGAADGDRGLVTQRPEVRTRHRLEEYVVSPLGVEEGCAGAPRLPRVVHGRQLLEIERDRLGQILGCGPVVRDAGGEDLADMAHPFGGEYRLARPLETRQGGGGVDGGDAGKVGRGEHVVLATARLRHSSYPRVGDRAPHERHVARAREPEVGHEFPLAEEVPVVLVARDARPDPPDRRRRVPHRLTAAPRRAREKRPLRRACRIGRIGSTPSRSSRKWRRPRTGYRP